MAKKAIYSIFIGFFLLAIMNFTASALVVRNIDIPSIAPGETAEIRIVVENDAEDDVKDVSFALDLTNTPFSTSGSSEDVLDEIEEDEDGVFIFTLRADNQAEPRNYNIPYTLNYRNASQVRKGTLGVLISGNTDLEFAASVENPIVGRKGSIDFRIINKGNADARFVNLEILPEGYTLLSEKKVYIGTVNADDFESVSIDAIFNRKNSRMYGVVEYVDFDNNKIIKNIDIPLTIYTQDEAIEKGIAKKNNAMLYVAIIVALIIIWIIWRAVAKSLRKRRSMRRENSA